MPHFPRFRALALFGRRPPQRVDSLVMPASENLHIVGSKYACVQCEIPADLPFRKTSLRYPILVGLTHKLMRKYSAYARGEPSIPVVFRCRNRWAKRATAWPSHGKASSNGD